MTGKKPWSSLNQKHPAQDGFDPRPGAHLSPSQEADLVQEVITLSPFFEKFALNSVAMTERQIAALKTRVLHLDAKTFFKLTDRYGAGEEWRALADAHLLAVHACIEKLGMRLDLD